MAVLALAAAAVGGSPESALAAEAARGPIEDRGRPAVEAVPGVQVRFEAVMGARIEACVDRWLLVAPDANPGMLEMFRRRDRHPAPDLVPWAGEFIGKYLLGAIRTLPLTEDRRLEPYVRRVLRAFLATQAPDGYLGPFPEAERLLGRWDLWGHEHAILALLLWHERTGDPEALRAAVAAGRKICDTYLEAGRRVFDAGSHEMNMAVIHALARLYRATGEPRFLRMVREIERDWERAGDYLRTGLAGVPFFRTPRPRWESLHDLQGLLELYRITGDDRYRRAFVHHWRSILRHDRHPSGGFSTGERAVGNPYTPGAIETCCTIAWMALTADMLRLTGDPRAADELELSTWNSVLGSQHPSGRWWTYSTPMDGVRKASAHEIVFQARPGAPELNCCSANAPRGLGLLSVWAVMRDAAGLFVNYYGPCRIHATLADGTPVTLVQETAYPAHGRILLRIGLEREARFVLRLRIPHWSRRTSVRVRGLPVAAGPDADRPRVRPGTYLAIDRTWRDGDAIEIDLDLSPRHWTGEGARAGRAALYRGPLLLGFDPHFNAPDTDAIPTLDLEALRWTRVEVPGPDEPGRFGPIVLWRVEGPAGGPILLCDFASCGAHGTHYTAWLPAVHGGPPPVWLLRPRRGGRVAAGPVLLRWTGCGGAEGSRPTFTVIVGRDRDLREALVRKEGIGGTHVVLREGFAPDARYFWKVIARNPYGSRENGLGPAAFVVDAALENTVERELALHRRGPRDLLVASPLDGDGAPSFGVLAEEAGTRPAADRFGKEGRAVAFRGAHGAIRYRLAEFPARDYTFYAWVCPKGLPADRLQQVVSAWCAGMDDPLRIVFERAAVHARIEAGRGYGTAGVPVKNDVWIHVAAVKEGPHLRLYVNGTLRREADVPAFLFSAARDFAIGGNPHYEGDESLVGLVDDFGFHARALREEDIAAIHRAGAARREEP